MRKRELGTTGEKLSIVGFGGIVVKDTEQSKADYYVAQAIDRGVSYFDVAPTYGNAEERLGPALEPYRQSVFLACKTHERTAQGASEDLHRSLQRLRTDYFDLYQLHAVTTMDEVRQVTGSGGALETLVKARDQGQVRYLGFSAHSEEAALALLDLFGFDSVLFPVNWVCWHQAGFGPKVLEKAIGQGVGVLALKALAKEQRDDGEERLRWPKSWYRPVESLEEASQALRFTLSQPVTAAVSPGHAELLWWACDAADRFEPLSEEEAAQVAARSEGLRPIFPR